MSRKLVSLIQDIKGLPGKYKRVLLAWAAFANNDGTNIFATKESVGKKAGISRWTVYRHTEDLIYAGFMQIAESHTCKFPRCTKGSTHFSTQHGQYTVVYEVNARALLQNATVLIEQLKEATVAKQQKATVAKAQKGTVAKCDATQALKHTPAAAGQETTIPPVPGEASESDRQFSPQAATSCVSEPFTEQEEKLLEAIQPIKMRDGQTKELLDQIIIILATWDIDPHDLLRYNRAHKLGNLYIRTPKQYLSALESDEVALVNEYLTHNYLKCEKCVRGRVLGPEEVKEMREREIEKQNKARALAQAKAWVEGQAGTWDFTTVDPDTFQRFKAIVRPGDDKWLPVGFSLSEQMHGPNSGAWSAAMRYVVRAAEYVTFEQFKKFVDTAQCYSEYVAKFPEWEAELNDSGMAFEAEEV